MTSVIPPVPCTTCRWFYGITASEEKPDRGVPPKAIYRCEAFPGGIPTKIHVGDNNHRKPVKGDQGIQYERLVEDEETT